MRHADGTFDAFDAPGPSATYPKAVNNNGEITGSFTDANEKQHVFLRYEGGAIVTVDVQEGNRFNAEATSINNNGDIVGFYSAPLPDSFFQDLKRRVD